MNGKISWRNASLLVVCSILVGGCSSQQSGLADHDSALDLAAPTASPAPSASALPMAGLLSPQEELGFSLSVGGTDVVNDEAFDAMFFEEYGVNPFVDTDEDNLSTFAVDVDTGSYTIMRSYIQRGELPPDEAVRVEEYVNFFDQDYTPPAEGEGAFSIHLEGAPSYFGSEVHQLVRIGLQGYMPSGEDRPDVVLTFVIDVSGSMSMETRLELVKDALELLVNELRPTDQIGIAVYGTNGRMILRHTPVAESTTILSAINRLQPEGATNAEEGLTIGYQMASEAFDSEAINRVILCSDGVANVGNTGADSIWDQIEDYAEQGIYLTTVGFGMGNYNDVLMEQLADQGDGFYAYVDTITEAERLFVDRLPSTLQVIARDAKIQVEFNPDVVRSYRLIGYENRDIADEDFRDDEVDAGEIGIGHRHRSLRGQALGRGFPGRDSAHRLHPLRGSQLGRDYRDQPDDDAERLRLHLRRCLDPLPARRGRRRVRRGTARELLGPRFEPGGRPGAGSTRGRIRTGR